METPSPYSISRLQYDNGHQGYSIAFADLGPQKADADNIYCTPFAVLNVLSNMYHVLVYTKYPVPGFAKTRLIPQLGKSASAAVSRQLSERCMHTVREFARGVSDHISVQVHIHFAGRDASTDSMTKWLGCGKNEKFIPQCSGSLGERLYSGFHASFRSKASKVVVIGTDIPEISAQLLTQAFQELDSKDVVVGPAEDGGYYLLGMKAPLPALFTDIPWSTDQVMALTKKAVLENNLSLATLATLRDVDLPSDLPYLSQFMPIPQHAE